MFKTLIKEFRTKRRIIFITTVSAFNAICLNKQTQYKNALIIVVGTFALKYKLLDKNFYLLPLTDKYFKPYSLLSKFSVIYADILQLLISAIFLLENKDNVVIFTSILNSRTLYFIDSIDSSKVEVFDWQSEYIFNYMNKRKIENGLLKLRYGDFIFRRNHILKCKYTFPENNNKKIYKLFEYSIDGSILILQNPNRKIIYFEKLVNLLNNSNPIGNNKLIIMIHPKTSLSEKKKLRIYLQQNLIGSKFILQTAQEIINSSVAKIYISICFTFGSTLDFLFFEKKIPVTSPNLNYNFNNKIKKSSNGI